MTEIPPRRAKYKNRTKADGCVPTQAEYRRTWRAENPKLQRAITDRFLVRYSISREVWARTLLNAIRGRCKKRSMPFNLEIEDILSAIPPDNLCPIMRTHFQFGNGRSGLNPSVDRVDPRLGYVKGNVAIISARANAMKGDCTDPDELRRLAAWMEEKPGAAPRN